MSRKLTKTLAIPIPVFFARLQLEAGEVLRPHHYNRRDLTWSIRMRLRLTLNYRALQLSRAACSVRASVEKNLGFIKANPVVFGFSGF